MNVFLEIRSGPGAGIVIALQFKQTVRLGRNPKADYSFPHDPKMSGMHFAVELSEKGCRLLDLNTTNGTFLNGARIKDAVLTNGDEIRVGNTVFVLRMLRDDAPLPPGLTLASPGPIIPQGYEPTERDRSRAFLPKPDVIPSIPVGSVSPSPPPALKPGELPSFPASVPPVSFPAAAPAAKLEPPAPRKPSLQDLLRNDFQPLFALLDAAREPSVLKVIYESKEEFQSLYEGAQGAQLAHFAPYLIRVPPKSPLVETLARQAWSKSWGVFLTSDKPLKDLRTHFRHFLNVKLPDGKQVYFRYYDPRVLRLFLPTCLPEETTQFFGPVKQFLIEAEDPKLALHFTRGPKGATQKDLHLAPA